MGITGKSLKLKVNTPVSTMHAKQSTTSRYSSHHLKIYCSIFTPYHTTKFCIYRYSTIFAYGQTGTGKTYTMFGAELDSKLASENVGLVNKSWGIIPRAIDDLFKAIKKTTGGGKPRVTCSIMQVITLFEALI